MVAILTITLTMAAEISNFLSAFVVMICFFCMVVFILRIRGEDVFRASVVRVARSPKAQVAYEKVDVPFSVELNKGREASFNDVQLKVRGDVNYALRSFWGVPSDRLHMLLAAPWTNFFLHLMEEPAIGAQVVDDVLREDVSGAGESVKQLGLSPGAHSLSLGPMPRTTYPLVVCVTRRDDDDNDGAPQQRSDDDTPDTRVGALITIIHIKDQECQVPTYVLHQYLKQYSGQLTRLEALYTQGDTDRPLSSRESREQQSEEGNADEEGEKKEENNEEEEEKKENNEKEEKKKENIEEEEKKENNEEEEKKENNEEVEENNEEEEEEEEKEIPLEESCVVCRAKRITRALLPCRHVCLCYDCCMQLNECPMCRSLIQSYFLVAPEPPAASQGQQEGTADGGRGIVGRQTFWHWFNGAVNRMIRIELRIDL